MLSAVAAQRQIQATETISVTQSISLLKNLSRAIVSNIAFLRGLVPQDGFKEVKVDTLNIHMLDESRNELGDRIISWLDRGAFVALERGYLESLCFEIRDTVGELLELYTLDFSRKEAGTSVSKTGKETQVSMPSTKGRSPLVMTKAKMKQELIHCLRALIVLSQTMNVLPPADGITVGMRLYYNDTVPDDFEPPKFTRATHESKGMKGDDSFSMQLGSVVTPSHSVAVRCELTESLMPDDSDQRDDGDGVPIGKVEALSIHTGHSQSSQVEPLVPANPQHVERKVATAAAASPTSRRKRTMKLRTQKAAHSSATTNVRGKPSAGGRQRASVDYFVPHVQ